MTNSLTPSADPLVEIRPGVWIRRHYLAAAPPAASMPEPTPVPALAH